MKSKESNKEKMLNINFKQKDYYEFDIKDDFQYGTGNKITKIWSIIRNYQYKMTDDLKINSSLIDLQKKWIGDLSNKKVLDFGCHTGNELSEYLALNSKEYCALDLSSSALSTLETKFKRNNISNYKMFPIDILSEEFKENNFDIIYAKGVFHHFKYLEVLLKRMKEILKPGGIIITSDPLNTYIPLKIIRAIYRPFQKDRDWEFPFTKDSFRLIQKYFNIENLAGIMGSTKYLFPIYLLSSKYALKLSEKLIKKDFFDVRINTHSLWKCLRVSMLLRNSKHTDI